MVDNLMTPAEKQAWDRGYWYGHQRATLFARNARLLDTIKGFVLGLAVALLAVLLFAR